MISPEQGVAVIHQRFGRHAGYRALHAKGIVCGGTFTATPEAASLTRAAHMQGTPTPVTAPIIAATTMCARADPAMADTIAQRLDGEGHVRMMPVKGAK